MVTPRWRVAVRLGGLTIILLMVLTGAASERAMPAVLACGPFIDFEVFTSLVEPDIPTFVRGELGIIQRTYRRRYLLAAWRTLRGKPMTRLEQGAYVASPASPQRNDPVQTWLDARSVVRGLQPLAGRPEQHGLLSAQNLYTYVTNCGNHAFVTAAATLADRRTRMEPAALTEWVLAQDAVFSNCGRRFNRTASIPAALPAGAPALARADRAYQMAAARFYAGQYREAEAEFAAIARDRSSPWQSLGALP